MRRVKYGVFKNIQKILKIKLKSFSWCQKIQNDLQQNQLREPFPIPQSFPLQNLEKFGALCWRK
jgi:adenine specific DNA methylase Mod